MVTILDNSKVDFIFSDDKLSNGAIKFYKKAMKVGSSFNTYSLLGQEVEHTNDHTEYFGKGNKYHIGLSLIKYSLEETLERIEENDFRDSEYNMICLMYGIIPEDEDIIN